MTLRLWHLAAVPAVLALVLLAVLTQRGHETRVVVVTTTTQPGEGDPDVRAAARNAAEDYNIQTAAANVLAATPAVEAWNADHGGYAGMSETVLRNEYDRTLARFHVAIAFRDLYCMESVVGSQAAHKAGPDAQIIPGRCGSTGTYGRVGQRRVYEDPLGTGCDAEAVNRDGYCLGDFYGDGQTPGDGE